MPLQNKGLSSLLRAYPCREKVFSLLTPTELALFCGAVPVVLTYNERKVYLNVLRELGHMSTFCEKLESCGAVIQYSEDGLAHLSSRISKALLGQKPKPGTDIPECALSIKCPFSQSEAIHKKATLMVEDVPFLTRLAGPEEHAKAYLYLDKEAYPVKVTVCIFTLAFFESQRTAAELFQDTELYCSSPMVFELVPTALRDFYPQPPTDAGSRHVPPGTLLGHFSVAPLKELTLEEEDVSHACLTTLSSIREATVVTLALCIPERNRHRLDFGHRRYVRARFS